MQFSRIWRKTFQKFQTFGKLCEIRNFNLFLIRQLLLGLNPVVAFFATTEKGVFRFDNFQKAKAHTHLFLVLKINELW
jgi:hypothetical protein